MNKKLRLKRDLASITYHSFIKDQLIQENPDLEDVYDNLINYLENYGFYNADKNIDDWDNLIWCLTNLVSQPEYKELLDIGINDLTDEIIEKIHHLAQLICNYIADEKRIYFEKQGIEFKHCNISDRLISRIIFVTLGCMPIYNTSTTLALKKLGLVSTISIKSLKQIRDFILNNKEFFENEEKVIRLDAIYPQLDLYLDHVINNKRV